MRVMRYNRLSRFINIKFNKIAYKSETNSTIYLMGLKDG